MLIHVFWADDDQDVIEVVPELFDRWREFERAVDFQAFNDPLTLQASVMGLLRKEEREVGGVLVITDNSMPECVGWELIRDLRAFHAAIASPIRLELLMVAAAPPEVAERVRGYGGTFLPKPMDVRRLRTLLNPLIRGL